MYQCSFKKWVHNLNTGDMEGAYRILVRKPERKIPLANLGLDGRIILK